MTTKLERLLEKESQLKAQIQLAKAAERTLEKKKDTRRKILIGAAVMARVEHGEWPHDDLLVMMDGFLTRPNERDLFELDEDSEPAATAVSVGAKKKVSASSGRTTKADGDKKEPQAQKQARMMPESNLDIEAEFNL